MKKYSFELFILAVCGALFAPSAMAMNAGRILAMTKTGNSIVLDLGHHDQIQENERAFLYEIGGTDERPLLTKKSYLELIKSMSDKSYWYIHKNFQMDPLEVGKIYLIFTESESLSGRELSIQHTQNVVFQDFQKAEKNSELSEVPKDLLVERDDYQDLRAFKVEKKVAKDAIQIASKTKWIKLEKKIRLANFPDELSIRETELDHLTMPLPMLKQKVSSYLHEQVADAFEQKLKSQKTDLNYGLYKNVKEMREKNAQLQQIDIDSSYALKKEQENEKPIIHPRVLAKKERDGDNWSREFNQKELRKYFVETGIEEESRRQELALNEREGHEVKVRFAGGLSQHTVAEDANYQSHDYSFGLSYDLHLARIAQGLKNWSFEFSYDRNYGHYGAGNVNVKTAENILGGVLNYYLINQPISVNRFIWYTGIGMKRGNVDLSGNQLSKNYDFQMTSLPYCQTGIKYRFYAGDTIEEAFKVGTAFDFGLSYQKLSMKSVDVVTDPIDGTFEYTDLKYYFGLNFYF